MCPGFCQVYIYLYWKRLTKELEKQIAIDKPDPKYMGRLFITDALRVSLAFT